MLRAITMLVMIFVNDLWSIHDVPHWLLHAEYGEDFAGLADFVFPSFLFAMGMSIPYAIENRYSKGLSAESTLKHILLRSFALLVMGAFTVNSGDFADTMPYNLSIYNILMFAAFVLVWNRYPSGKAYQMLWTLLRCLGCGILIYLMFTCRHSDGSPFAASWWGILGLIGWAYLLCAVIYMLFRNRPMVLAGIFVLFVLLCVVNTPLREEFGATPLLNLPRGHFYGSLLGVVHMGNGCLVSLTMGGVVLSLVSARICNIRPSKRLLFGIAGALVLLVVALCFHKFFIVSKLGETPTWTFFTFAICVALYFTLSRLVELGLYSVVQNYQTGRNGNIDRLHYAIRGLRNSRNYRLACSSMDDLRLVWHSCMYSFFLCNDLDCRTFREDEYQLESVMKHLSQGHRKP